MTRGVLVSHDLSDRLFKSIERAVKAVGHRQLLEVKPEPFDGIEKRTVLGQPDDQQAILKQAQSRLGGFAAVVRGVVHHQDHLLARIGVEEMLEEGDEGITVFVLGGGVSDPSTVPVVSTKDMQLLWAPGCGDLLALPTLHPAAAQGRMQTYRGFVHKDEFGVGNRVKRDVFFNQSVTSAITSLAVAFWRWLRSCFGCFQR
jgi:hypothetical protein